MAATVSTWERSVTLMYPHSRRVIAAVAVAGLVVALGACSKSKSSSGGGSTASAPGVTATTVTVGTHQPLTGPAAPGYSKISAATKAYFAYLNAKGGINGRTIVYKIMDDGYNPATTQTDVRQLVLNDKVFAILNGLGTPTHTGVLDFLKTNNVPDLFVASGSRSWNQPTKYPDTFGFQPDYTIEGKIIGTYLKANNAGQKICFFGQGDDFGSDELAGLTQILGAAGLTSKQTYNVLNQNVGPQMGALKAAGCQVVVAATIPGFTALALGTSFQVGFHAQWVVSNVGADYATVAGLLTAKGAPLLEGVITDGYLPAASDASDAWVTQWKQINQQYNGNAPWDGNVEYGMAVGYMFAQALLRAGKNPTRASILKAVEQGNFTGPGIVPVAFSATNHSGYSGVRMAKISSQAAAYFGPTYTTDSTTGPVVPYSGGETTPPANLIPTS
jgi:branched-chain amino acid transport system substrate-binding protein